MTALSILAFSLVHGILQSSLVQSPLKLSLPEDFTNGPPADVEGEEPMPELTALGRNHDGHKASHGGVHRAKKHKRLEPPQEQSEVQTGFGFIQPKVEMMQKFVHFVEKRIGTVNGAIQKVEKGLKAELERTADTRKESNAITTLLARANLGADDLEAVMKDEKTTIRKVAEAVAVLKAENEQEDRELHETVSGLEVVDTQLNAAQASIGDKVANLHRKNKAFFEWSYRASGVINENTEALHAVVDKFAMVDGKCGSLVDRLIGLIEKTNIAAKKKEELLEQERIRQENAGAAADLANGATNSTEPTAAEGTAAAH